ncbi:MAG: PSD1 and planctomycete cytochrome C domain-containing protein [Bythopirellula sp.]
MTTKRVVLFCCVVVALSAKNGRAAPTVQYNRDVRPILSKNCFACHGLDEASREAGLRLDRRASAVSTLDSGAKAIVPGELGASELIARIQSRDSDLQMPPPDSNKQLTAAEVEVLTRWIDEGADYELHWSLTQPQKTPIPQIPSSDTQLAPIDAFIRARLQQEDLPPAPEANKRALIRRLSLDLIGLPPTPQEVRAFVEDGRPDSYERLVDRLLDSPHYGERMALVWLDAARYADTHGYHIDSHRVMWPWRDWVIKAYNENLSFKDFTIWQIAGDLLPDATVEQQVASGFNRNHGINYEGGAIPEEYLVEYVVDRANTTGSVWMGLTLGCARCHDHKYDPITQEEYFKFFAFFNTIDEQGLDGQRGNAQPMLSLPNQQQQAEQDRLVAEIKRLENEINPWKKQLDSQQQAWEAAVREKNSTQSESIADSHWHGLPPIIEETIAEVLATDYLTGDDSIDVTKRVSIKGKDRDWTPMTSMVDGYPHTNFIFERSANYLWRRITVDTRQRATISAGCTDALKLWFNGRLLLDQQGATPMPERQHEFEVELLPGDNYLLAKVVNISWECDFYFAIRRTHERLPNAVAKIVIQPGDKRSDDDAQRIKQYFRENVVDAPAYHQLRHDLLANRRKLERLKQRITTTMVMRKMAKPRKTFRLDRGQYDSPKEEVSPVTPSILPPLPTEGPTDRLALASWLTSPGHPLTARVAVNRLWQMLFGVGLVATSGDFGTQGEWPSHPELLDWLAVEFVESGWDVKQMLRRLVNSATYRQSSAATPAKLARDPNNRLLSRGPRFRLQAELIRDMALYTSGLLNNKIGGRSEMNYQPPGMWLELAHQKDNSKFTAQQFEQATGQALYRRGLYTFWKRSVPPPNLVTFDAPNREICVVQREITNTPLQALVMLNDPTFVEAARFLAERMIREASSIEDRARLGFLLATARQPTQQELQILVDKFRWHLAEFTADLKSAEQLLRVGDAARDSTIPPAEHAAWACVASMILNLDETLTKE